MTMALETGESMHGGTRARPEQEPGGTEATLSSLRDKAGAQSRQRRGKEGATQQQHSKRTTAGAQRAPAAKRAEKSDRARRLEARRARVGAATLRCALLRRSHTHPRTNSSAQDWTPLRATGHQSSHRAESAAQAEKRSVAAMIDPPAGKACLDTDRCAALGVDRRGSSRPSLLTQTGGLNRSKSDTPLHHSFLALRPSARPFVPDEHPPRPSVHARRLFAV